MIGLYYRAGLCCDAALGFRGHRWFSEPILSSPDKIVSSTGVLRLQWAGEGARAGLCFSAPCGLPRPCPRSWAPRSYPWGRSQRSQQGREVPPLLGVGGQLCWAASSHGLPEGQGGLSAGDSFPEGRHVPLCHSHQAQKQRWHSLPEFPASRTGC